jgi:DNA-binding NtrC family response regulator
MEEALIQRGFAISLCESGTEAIDWISAGRADIVITDLLMPNGGGLKVLEVAAEHSIPCVVFTGFVDAYRTQIPHSALTLIKGETDLDGLADAVRMLADQRAAVAS